MGGVPGATRRSLFAQVRFVPRDGKRFAAAGAAQHLRNGEQWRAVVTARTHAIVLAPALGQPRVPRGARDYRPVARRRTDQLHRLARHRDKRAGQFKDDVLFGKLGHPIPRAPPDGVVPIELDARPVKPERAIPFSRIASRLRPAVKSRAGGSGSLLNNPATTAPVIALTTPHTRERGKFTMNTTWSRREFLELSRSEEHTSELQSQSNLVCRLLLEKK